MMADDDYETFTEEAVSDAESIAAVSSTSASTGEKKKRAPRTKKEVVEETVRIREFDLNSIPPHKPTDASGVKIVVIGKAGCHAAGTQIMMNDGSTQAVETVQVGDLIMGDDGTPRTVLQLCRGEEEMFEIQPSYGEPYVVNLKHKLVLRSTIDQSIDMPTVEEYLAKEEEYKQTYQVFKADCIHTWHRVDTPIDPYVYGYNLKGAGREETCIPLCYKKNSKEVRLAILAGILDEFGDEDHYIINCDSIQRFADDIIFIARSLGLTARYIPERQKIYIGTTDSKQIPCKMYRYISDDSLACFFTIKPLGVDKYYGFTLDANNLYLLKSFDVVRNTGKSTLIQSLLASKAHIAPVIQVFNGTEDANGSYSKRCPPVLVYDKLDINAMIQFKNRQTLAGKHLPENAWAIQVIDDCADDPKILRNPVIQAYYKNGRHWHMIHILSLQYALDIMPSIRVNIDYTFILRESNKKIRKKLYENYCSSAVQEFSDFEALMDACTTDYGALVICNRTTSNKLEDCVFYYRADPNSVSPTWHFGHQTLWDFNNERYDENHEVDLMSTI